MSENFLTVLLVGALILVPPYITARIYARYEDDANLGDWFMMVVETIFAPFSLFELIKREEWRPSGILLLISLIVSVVLVRHLAPNQKWLWIAGIVYWVAMFLIWCICQFFDAAGTADVEE